MKQIKYFLDGKAVLLGYSEENLRMAEQEADNGECTIVDDGLPEEQTPEQRIAELEEALTALLEGLVG